MTLLVVDDQPLARTLICKVFEADGYACRIAGSLVEAAEAVTTDTIDGMVVDLQFAEEKAVSWLEQVSRDRPGLTQHTVVATSADLGAEGRRRVATLGSVLLLRPFSVETLRSIVVDLTPAPRVNGGNARDGLGIPPALARLREERVVKPERRSRDRRVRKELLRGPRGSEA